MAKLIALSAAADNLVHFNRTELTLLLNLYARRMAEGQWRDYAIEHGPGCAVFLIYGSSRERPELTVSKTAKRVYVAAQGDRQLARSGALADVLKALEHGPIC